MFIDEIKVEGFYINMFAKLLQDLAVTGIQVVDFVISHTELFVGNILLVYHRGILVFKVNLLVDVVMELLLQLHDSALKVRHHT